MSEHEKTEPAEDSLDDMDRAARANLSPRQLAEYARYKSDLLARNEPISSIREILTGWIWDEGEEPPK